MIPHVPSPSHSQQYRGGTQIEPDPRKSVQSLRICVGSGVGSFCLWAARFGRRGWELRGVQVCGQLAQSAAELTGRRLRRHQVRRTLSVLITVNTT